MSLCVQTDFSYNLVDSVVASTHFMVTNQVDFLLIRSLKMLIVDLKVSNTSALSG